MQVRIKRKLLFLRNTYAPDPRALGLMRIGLAIVVLCDLIVRASDLSAHYSDAGCWPSSLIRHSGWKDGFWTFHDLFNNPQWLVLLFCIHGLIAFLVLLGFRTRLTTLLLLLLTISLHNRNIFILQGGDDALRLAMLWGLLMGWGNAWSLDARQNRISAIPWMASAGYLIFLASIYLFSVLLKTGADWHEDNTAVYYALSLEQIRLPLGDQIYGNQNLLLFLTASAYYTELMIPLLILFPSKTARGIAFLLILILHLGISLLLYVGFFFIISICVSLGLLPGAVFDRIEKKWLKFFVKGPVKKSDWSVLALNNIAIVIIVLSLTINLSYMPWFSYSLNPTVQKVASFIRLDQYWGMFSPQVLRKDGWLVYHGMDSLGRQWDLRLNQDYVEYKKPEHIVDMYKTDRWRKLAENMQDPRFTFLRPLYCRYILKKWNRDHPEKKILLLNLYFMEKENLADYKIRGPEKILYSVCNEQ